MVQIQHISAQKHKRHAHRLSRLYGSFRRILDVSSSSDDYLPLFLEGKVLENLMKALVVRILFFYFFRFIVRITFIIFEVELPSEDCENVLEYE